MSIETEVELLKKDIAQVNNIMGKLDTAIEKMSDVALGVRQMLAVHEARLAQGDAIHKELFDAIEDRRKETMDRYENLHVKISQVKKELEMENEKIEKDILKELKEMRHDQEAQHNAMLSRIGDLENWKWKVVGLAAGIAFIFSNFSTLTKILGG